MKNAWVVILFLLGCGSSGSSHHPDGGADLSVGDASVHVPATGTPAGHRASPGMCAPIAAGSCAGAYTSDMGSQCRQDSECTSGTDGRCVTTRSFPCQCIYDTCATDTDCGATQLCACAGAGAMSSTNRCVPSNCRVDADCPTSQYCAPALDATCGTFFGVTSYECTTPNDQCRLDSDCNAGGFCTYSPEVGYWACSYGACAG